MKLNNTYNKTRKAKTTRKLISMKNSKFKIKLKSTIFKNNLTFSSNLKKTKSTKKT